MWASLTLRLSLLTLIATPLACSAAERLSKRVELTIPVSEVSGFAVRAATNGQFELLAVGDEANELVAIPLGADGPDVSKAVRIALPVPAGEGGSEFEGVEVDEHGLVHVLIERGEVASFRLVNGVAFLVRRRTFEVPRGHALAAAWEDAPNARAEGLVHFGGRMLVAKQKDPVALIELEEAGDVLRFGRHWRLEGLDDASDLMADGGALYVVGAKSARLCRIDRLPEEGGTVGCDQRWELPHQLGEQKARWEGLGRLPDGRVILGSDRKGLDAPNTAILEPSR